MPLVEASVEVPVDPATAFAVSQTTGAVRRRWDPFIRGQRFLDGATEPGKGVRTLTIHRAGFRMISEYVSYQPPTNVGMRMVEGSWFFAKMGGGWRFTPVPGEPGRTRAVWRYNFGCRPRWLAPVAERIGTFVLRREIEHRIARFARACSDPVVLAAIRGGDVPPPAGDGAARD
ncbi:type II toxin-antitoxin system RatA family toxin [Embleya sp. NPDC050493]|uniref:type II toxin-antitoxin system RatA family toxin n=1 Tax=Embleya sp. NPDC050493 TaxID=3363989 RepID=UPI0037A61B79